MYGEENGLEENGMRYCWLKTGDSREWGCRNSSNFTIPDLLDHYSGTSLATNWCYHFQYNVLLYILYEVA